MAAHDIFEFAKREHERLVTHYGVDEDPKTKYAMLAKLMEEVGELSEAILHTDALQRKDKLKEKNIDLPGEFADVMLATAVLAQELDVDLHDALEKKMEKIQKRKY